MTYGFSDKDYCASDTSIYRSKVENYLDCLKDESKAMIEQYNSTVSKFNCQREGNRYCF
jgi:hypothetical protein